ncbi:hypothetical protein [Kitasatospora sp. NPDC057198]|uniref:hypothetical protein n=1 Tax=Kitasatospora sp. NPDC057198 TaxID=3346046 RepID=UPI003637C485
MEQLVPELVRVWGERVDFPAVGFGPARPDGELPAELPADVRRLLALSDGIHFGVWASVHAGASIPAYQGPEVLAHAARIDNPGDYLNIGDVADDPLLFDLRDGGVLVARAEPRGLWYQGCELVRIADGLDAFLSGWVAGPRFPELVRPWPEDEEDRDFSRDDWWRLLRAAGRVPA